MWVHQRVTKTDKNMKHLVFGWACAGWTSFQTGSNQLAQAIELLISSSMCQSDVSPESLKAFRLFFLWVSYWGSPMGLLCRAFHTEVYWIWTWFIYIHLLFWQVLMTCHSPHFGWSRCLSCGEVSLVGFNRCFMGFMMFWYMSILECFFF